MAIINKQKRKKITSVRDAMEKLESLCTVNGNVNVVAAVKKKHSSSSKYSSLWGKNPEE